MVFCNLVGNNLPETFNRRLGKSAGIPLRIETTEVCETYGSSAFGVWVQSNGSEVVIRHADENGNGAVVENNLFALTGNRDEEVIPFYKRKNEKPILWADVQETEENPAIICICKSIHLVNGIKSYIKLLNVNKDYVVVMLVSGAIGFEDESGEVITLVRNLQEGISTSGRKTRKMSPAELNDMLSLKDTNGYRYNMDMAISVYAYYGDGMTNIRVIRDACVIFDPKAEERAKAAADAIAEKARMEEERKKREAEEAEAHRIQQEKLRAQKAEIERIREEARREASKAAARDKAAATRAAKKAENSEKSEIKTPEGANRNVGAEFFLSMLGKC